MEEGVYALLVRVEPDIAVEAGALGELELPAGIYVYAGSAMNGLESRLSRHILSTEKKFWHIDYLTEQAEVVDWITLPTGDSGMECWLAEAVEDAGGEPVPGFGASDCGCGSHLFRFNLNG